LPDVSGALSDVSGASAAGASAFGAAGLADDGDPVEVVDVPGADWAGIRVVVAADGAAVGPPGRSWVGVLGVGVAGRCVGELGVVELGVVALCPPGADAAAPGVRPDCGVDGVFVVVELVGVAPAPVPDGTTFGPSDFGWAWAAVPSPADGD